MNSSFVTWILSMTQMYRVLPPFICSLACSHHSNKETNPATPPATPPFPQDSYSFLVPEDAGVDSVVAMVTVTDRDTDMRGMVGFILEGGGGAFRVRPRRVDNRQTWGGEIIVARVCTRRSPTCVCV